jgi:hypothetical protein
MTVIGQRSAHKNGEEAMGRRPGWVRRLPAVAVLVALVVVEFGEYAMRGGPEPRPVSAPMGEFSADRAFAHVERIAAEPHPIGTAANAAVRDYILAELAGLGLQPRVLAATAVRARSWPGWRTSTRGFRDGRAPATSC